MKRTQTHRDPQIINTRSAGNTGRTGNAGNAGDTGSTCTVSAPMRSWRCFVFALLTAALLLTAVLPSGTRLTAAQTSVTQLAAAQTSGTRLTAAGKVRDSSPARTEYRAPQSEGVANVLRNALYMYNTFWTPCADISAWGTSENTSKLFVAGHTYRGIPYGQPVHEGSYVGTTTSVPAFLAAVADPGSALYTSTGKNTWYYTDHGGPIWYCPYYSNDCSGFVSACLGVKRHTTRQIGAETDLFPVIGTDIELLRPGDLLNSVEGGHVILVYDVTYNRKGGKVSSVITIEQTPSIIVMRTFGQGGLTGTLSDLAHKIASNGYSIVRYKDIDSVPLMEGAEEGPVKTVNRVSAPASVLTADAPAEGRAYVDFTADSFGLEGFMLTSEPLTGFEYELNGGSKQALTAKYYSELTAPAFGFSCFDGQRGVNAYEGSVPLAGLAAGDTIEVYAVTATGTRQLSARLELAPAPEQQRFTTYLDSAYLSQSTGEICKVSEPYTPLRKNALVLNGWCAAPDIVRFEVSVDGGLWYPVYHSFRDDVYNATRGLYPECRDCNAFYLTVDMTGRKATADHTVSLRAVASDGGYFTVAECVYGGQTFAARLLWIVIPAAILLAAAVVVTVLVLKRRSKKQRAPETDVPDAPDAPGAPEAL